ncbi:TonB-dependent receptor [Parahaliea aestuarii]|uniref:TonB-dependent receptor n=1 Tax=Parahaliea aestuarii TaxID=1852021 RepID=A0A5C8ZV23_9GAMM|nr:TonB-dependent receptor [Parahaliea aestuarii]TXS91604.1 TonB-dependent receptor [Parahaliea aestuarii]
MAQQPLYLYCSVALLASAPVLAAAEPVKPAGTALEVITVTAQKREQRITDVPMSMSAYDGEFLEQIGGTELDRIAAITPGFVIQLQDKFAPGFSIRGITSNDFSPQSELRVAVFQDGVAVTQAASSYGELFDIDRIEVEKGPQSTLHGRSALNGGVSIFHKTPGDEPGFEVQGGVGDYDYRHLQGVANVPVTDTLAVRIGALMRERDGYVEDIGSDKTYNDIDARAYRFSARWEPSDKFSFNLVATLDEDDTNSTVPFKSGTFLPLDQESGEIVGDLDFWSPLHLDTFGTIPSPYFQREIRGASGTAEYYIDDRLSLTSITGYRWFDACESFDSDGTSTNMIAGHQCNGGEQLSEEIRLNFSGLGNFDGFVGASVFDASNYMSMDLGYDERAMALLLGGVLQPLAPRGLTNEEINALLGPTADFLKPFHLDRNETSADVRTYDLFADATLHLSEQLEVFAGARVTWDDKTVSMRGTTPLGPSNLTGGGILFNPTANGEAVSDDNSSTTTTGRAGVRYSFSDSLNWYAVYGIGKRPEVLNVNVDGSSEVIPTEELASVETGLKFQLLDNRLVGDTSVYYYEYENFQTQGLVDGRLSTVNAGEADATGFEAQFNYLASEAVNLFASYGYNKARLRSGAYDGNQFRNSPDHKFSLGANLALPLFGGSLELSPVYSWQSEMFFFDDNDKPELQQRVPAAYSDTRVDEFQDSFGLLSARLSYYGGSGNWSVALVGGNLTDEKYLVDAGNTGDYFGIPTFIGGSRRNVRAEFSFDF